MKFSDKPKSQIAFQITLLLFVLLLMIASVVGMFYVDLNVDAGLAPSLTRSEDLRLSMAFNTRQGLSSNTNLFGGFLGIVPVYIILCFMLPFLSPVRSSLVTLVCAGLVLAIGLSVGPQDDGLLLEFSLLTLVMIFSVHVLASFFTEFRDRQRLSSVFSQYIPPELAKNYYEKRSMSDLEGSARELSVLFCDIQGFTSLSEGMEPKELARLINAFLTEITKIIHKHGGTIDKYIGDSVMAFWGAPLADEQHQQHALEAALEIQQTMHRIRTDFAQRGWPRIEVGIGINSGTCNVGNMGSEFRIAYTAIGDNVNIAARLEKLTRFYQTPIILSESTVSAVSAHLFRELDIVNIRGRKGMVRIFEPLVNVQNKQAMLAEYDNALHLFRQQQWDEAHKVFTSILEQDPQDSHYSLYLASIEQYQQQPPLEGDRWTGSLLAARQQD